MTPVDMFFAYVHEKVKSSVDRIQSRLWIFVAPFISYNLYIFASLIKAKTVPLAYHFPKSGYKSKLSQVKDKRFHLNLVTGFHDVIITTV